MAICKSGRDEIRESGAGVGNYQGREWHGSELEQPNSRLNSTVAYFYLPSVPVPVISCSIIHTFP